MESTEYNAVLAITGAIRGTSRDSAAFSKYSKFNLLNISSEFFLLLVKRIIQELIVTLPSSVGKITFSEILFSHQLPLNGITEI